ncbi:hypothetical protein NDU88_007307 [Pleurodeles waltl]|uniref:Uncharacterized protein n=1 Tax=Pleurodeles waltl TaxID=8319 RepID=A0AAV7RUF4_PLEWA|nr:hypothetical protein NDU88_007307 [Pleurodeles waltl]
MATLEMSFHRVPGTRRLRKQMGLLDINDLQLCREQQGVLDYEGEAALALGLHGEVEEDRNTTVFILEWGCPPSCLQDSIFVLVMKEPGLREGPQEQAGTWCKLSM